MIELDFIEVADKFDLALILHEYGIVSGLILNQFIQVHTKESLTYSRLRSTYF